MHELSIVQDLFKLCETNALKYKRQKVTRVEVQIGKLSGVEEHYFKNTFDVFKEGTICSDAQLLIEIQELVVSCKDCGYSGTIPTNEFLCPHCNKPSLEIISGEDILLKRIELEVDDDEEEENINKE